MNDLSRKIWILAEGIFNTTENDLLRIMKMTYVKFLLEQCWHKGFHVNWYWANNKRNLITGFFFK